MAEKSKSKGLLKSLTGHVADFVTKNSGLTGSAAKKMGSRGKSIDAAVDAATSGSSQQKTKHWPWQNQ